MFFYKQTKLFRDRTEAGRLLAAKLRVYKKDKPVILALPRGGVPVGRQVARALNATFDCFVVRKIGVPSDPEYGIGALAEDNVLYIDQDAVSRLGIDKNVLLRIISAEDAEVKRRADLYRDGKELTALKGKTVILIDDGLATGVSALAAIKAVRLKEPKKLIFAVPVAAEDSIKKLEKFVDECVLLLAPKDLQAIGQFYRDFSQITDEEVISLMHKSDSKS